LLAESYAEDVAGGHARVAPASVGEWRRDGHRHGGGRQAAPELFGVAFFSSRVRIGGWRHWRRRIGQRGKGGVGAAPSGEVGAMGRRRRR